MLPGNEFTFRALNFTSRVVKFAMKHSAAYKPNQQISEKENGEKKEQ